MFDLRTHLRDVKTGVVVVKQPYQRVCEGGSIHYVRDGVKYHENGEPLPGQVIPEKKADPSTKKVDPEVQELKETVSAMMRSNELLQQKLDQLLADKKSEPAATTEAALATTPDGIPVAPSMPVFEAAETEEVESGSEAVPAPRRGRKPTPTIGG